MGLPSDILHMNIGQLFRTPFLPTANFAGRTIIITGANSGLGFEAAKHFYSLNVSHLVLACRNLTKGENARKEIVTSSGTSKRGKVEVWQLDMSNYSSVLAFGHRMKSLSRLDAFVANAGIDVNHWEMFEGYESTLTVNVISTFLVAILAIPKLRETSEEQQKPSHLIITGSVLHIFAKDKYLSQPQPGQIFKTLNNKSTADMSDRYNLSKLLVLLGARQLAGKLNRGSEKGRASVIVNYINPGWCKTDLFQTNDGGLGGRIGLRLMGRSAEEGSRTLVHGAATDEKSHGRYLTECRVKPESSFVRSDAGIVIEKRVWSELVDILEGIQPGVTNL